jgi:hypothetical protein
MTLPMLAGPFPLIAAAINVMPNTPGAYCLGDVARGGKFTISYIGRSDGDLARRLRGHIGNYSAYSYALAPSALSAFHIECGIYHSLMSPAQIGHPQRPADSAWTCPECGKFG